ncbi:MAG: response regulator [candidate division NC10 bacterium]|nr:response regulator [candidate division NC10 bacterium]MBI3003173.1 response regulator [candidate division NC10 bacterium]MBI4391618.1 response regulator [candidate division NC10 bacterium]
MSDTVLIIDDERLFRTLVTDHLAREGYRVLAAGSGEEGLKTLAEEPVHVVLLDLIIPGLDGMEVLRRIKAERPDLPVVMVTGYRRPERAINAVKEGAFDVVSKPVNLEELAQIIGRAVLLARSSRTTQRRQAQVQKLQASAVALADLVRWDLLGAFLQNNQVLFQRVIDFIAEVLEVEIVSLMLVDEATQTLRIAVARGISDDVIQSARPKVGQGIAGWVAQKGEPLLIKDIRQEATFSESRFYPRYTTRSLMSVPVKVNGRTMGVMNANNKHSGESFDEYDMALFTTFSCLVSLALANAQLFRQLTLSVEELAQTNLDLRRANRELERRLQQAG